MALQLQLSQPVFTTPQKDTEIQAESYIEKPLIVTTEITIEPKIKYFLSHDVEIIGISHDQCVIWLRNQTGNEKVRGVAGKLQPEGTEPRVGAIALERSVGHVSLVKDILPDGRLVLNDANWEYGYITKRIVSPESQRGYIY